MIRRAGAALVTAALCAAAVPGTAAAFKPEVGRYTATMPGTTSPNKLTLEVLQRNRTYRTRVLQLSDDCAGSLLPVPAGLGRIFAKDIKWETSGTSGSLSFGVKVEGLFTSARRATMRVRTNEDNLAPPPGTPAKVCSDDTTFALTLAKKKRR